MTVQAHYKYLLGIAGDSSRKWYRDYLFPLRFLKHKIWHYNLWSQILNSLLITIVVLSKANQSLMRDKFYLFFSAWCSNGRCIVVCSFVSVMCFRFIDQIVIPDGHKKKKKNSFYCRRSFSRVHATLQPTLSVCRSVCRSVGRSVTLYFRSHFFKDFEKNWV